MGNLIIKGKGGAGNKLIIQDQAGAAVLTTADSGATIADGVALGTPASGVLTNMTFPAGHVIQTVKRTYSVSNSDNTNSTSLTKALDASVAEYYCTINNVAANSKVLVNFHTQIFCLSTATEAGGGYGIFRGNTQLYDTYTYAMYARQDNTSGNKEWAWPVQISFLDESPDTGTNTYYLGIKSHHSSYTVFIMSTVDPGFVAVLQEIA